jgi:L-xylulose reductase
MICAQARATNSDADRVAIMRFEGKRVLVTGAGKGIGYATAKMLAERGAQVVAFSRSADDLDRLAGEIGCQTTEVDLADPKAARATAIAAQPTI